MHRLLQADSFEDKKVKTACDGIKLSSKQVIHEHNDDILEGNGSIKVTVKTPSTGGQQENPMIDASTTKESKGRSKRKGKKPKVTFVQLLEKYQKISEEKIAYRPNNSKASRSPPRHKSEDQYWQSENFSATYSYPYFGPPIPMSWILPYAYLNKYPSRDKYNSRAHYPSYYRSSHQHYVAPRKSTFDEKSHVKDRFTRKESVRSLRKKKEVVKQVYRVKKDGRKCATSDFITNDKEPIKVLTLATKGKEEEQTNVQNQDAKSEQKKMRMHKARKELPLVEIESQPRCPLGLSYWQKKELQKLSAHELRKKNMAWVPKRSSQNKNDVQPSIATSVTKVKKEKNERSKQFSRRFPSPPQNLRLAHHPYSSNISLMPMPWNSSPGMIGYPPWVYFDPWLQYNFLYHERVLPNHYTFD